VELDLQQARYDASLGERRYASCDPDNRLIAAQLEKSSEAALRRVEDCEARLEKARQADLATPIPDFTGLAADFEAAWRAPNVDMRCRQQLLRALVTDIIAEVDEEQREVILTNHWKGGQHSQLRNRKPKAGEHDQSTPEAALAVKCSMATRWSDADIAATLTRMGMQRGKERFGQRAVSARCAVHNPRVPIGRKEWRVAHSDRSRQEAWCHGPACSSVDQRRRPANRSCRMPRTKYELRAWKGPSHPIFALQRPVSHQNGTPKVPVSRRLRGGAV